MKCIDKNCTREMEKRSGKFGIFYYCPDHGTISEKGVKLLEQARESRTTTGNIQNYRDVPNVDPLMLEIKKQSLAFGVGLTELEKLVESDVDHKYYFGDRNDDDDEDDWNHTNPYSGDWTDIRPY